MSKVVLVTDSYIMQIKSEKQLLIIFAVKQYLLESVP